MESSDERTQAIMDALGIAPSSKAASGRYMRSERLRTGVRYWAGHARGEALFGVQFLGEGMGEAERLGAALEQAGFMARAPQPAQSTYCLGVALLAGGQLDVVALGAAKAELDRLLS